MFWLCLLAQYERLLLLFTFAIFAGCFGKCKANSWCIQACSAVFKNPRSVRGALFFIEQHALILPTTASDMTTSPSLIFWAYPQQRKTSPMFNVFSVSTSELMSNCFLIKIFKSGDNIQNCAWCLPVDIIWQVVESNRYQIMIKINIWRIFCLEISFKNCSPPTQLYWTLPSIWDYDQILERERNLFFTRTKRFYPDRF